ncbi:hypothetical protein Nmel_018238 [Mimus melanotis]
MEWKLFQTLSFSSKMANASFGLSLKTSGVQVIGENYQCVRSFLFWGGSLNVYLLV